MSASLPMNGGSFYSNSLTEVLVDPAMPNPTVQSQSKLQMEIRRCEALVQKDYRYAHLIAGASKMPMASIWVARNQDELVNDVDLATFKDLAWTEFVKKRFLPSVSPTTSVTSATVSMLEIVRDMNLQRRRFQIMGLHEQVEASELQLVMQLCKAGILGMRGNDFKRTALRLRRSNRLFEAFAMAVGAGVCASAPMTLGAGTSRYERDLQYEYKKQMVGLLVYALQNNPKAVDDEEGLDEDYVARISRLIVVWQGRGDENQMQVGASKDDGDDSIGDKEGLKQALIGMSSAIAIAQQDAERAKDGAKKVEEAVKEFRRTRDMEMQIGRDRMMAEVTRMGSEIDAKIDGHSGLLESAIDRMETTIRSNATLHAADMQTLTSELNNRDAGLKTQVFELLRGFFTTKDDGSQTAAQTMVQAAMTQYANDLSGKLQTEVHNIIAAIQIPAQVDAKIDARLHGLEAEIKQKADAALGNAGLDARISNIVGAHLASSEMAQLVNDYLDTVVGSRFANIEGRIVANEQLAAAEVQRVNGVEARLLGAIQNEANELGTQFDAMMDVMDTNAAGLDRVMRGLDAYMRKNDADVQLLIGTSDEHSEDIAENNNNIASVNGKLDTVTTDFGARLHALERQAPVKRGRGGVADDGEIDRKLDQFRTDIMQTLATNVRGLDARTTALENMPPPAAVPVVLTDELKDKILEFVNEALVKAIASLPGLTIPASDDPVNFHAFAIAPDGSMLYDQSNTQGAAYGPRGP